MAALFERAANLFGDNTHLPRTPSLTDTDDSAQSDEVPPLSPLPAPTSTKLSKERHPLLINTTRPRAMSGASASPMTTRTESPRTHVRTNSQASSMLFYARRPIVTALSKRGVLTSVLRYLTWHEFRCLVMTSHAIRALLDTDDCMDVILARFVPGYAYGERLANQIHVSLHDLETFILSQHISLHLYPTHALTVIDSLMNMMHLVSSTTERFQRLSAAHSRIVLLLRSRTLAARHSPEIDDAAIVSAAAASKGAATRQLTFPAPLFCAEPEELKLDEPVKNTIPPQPEAKLRRRLSTSKSVSSFLSFSPRRRAQPIPPPPPPARRAHRSSVVVSAHKRASTYGGHSSQRHSTLPPPSEDGYLSNLKPPKPFYRRHSSLPGSSTSSTGSLSATSKSVGHSRSSTEHLPTLLPAGPHDPLYAAIRGRAPVVRVFVPTDTLSIGSVKACESLLLRSGLWDRMIPGDIVCNLGYVPRTENDQRSPSQTPNVDEFGVVGMDNFASLLGDSNPADLQGWLIFTGTALVPHFPPAPPPPDIDALRLPGPAYYAHLGSPTTGLVYALKIPRASSECTMKLEPGSGFVRSSRGVARVRRWVWTAAFQVDSNENMGEGWAGQWVLEGMGTREGEKVLTDAMNGGDMRFWEFVREKSSHGRIWLRLVDTPALSVLDAEAGSTVTSPILASPFVASPTTAIGEAGISS